MKYFLNTLVPSMTLAAKSFRWLTTVVVVLASSKNETSHDDSPQLQPNTFFQDSNVFSHADTIATFQFQLHLKPPISASVAVIEIWNSAYIQGHYRQTQGALSSQSGRWGGTGRDTSQLGLIYIYSLFTKVALTFNLQLGLKAAAALMHVDFAESWFRQRFWQNSVPIRSSPD